MTRRELDQVRYLKLELQQEKRRLEELRLQSLCGGVDYSELIVKAGGHADRVCTIATEIAALEALIEENMHRCIAQILKVQRFIDSIDDSKMRMIVHYRCIKCKSWLQVAFAIGEYSESSVRSYYDRYLKRNSIK